MQVKNIHLLLLFMLGFAASADVFAVTKSRIAQLNSNISNGQKAIEESNALALKGEQEAAQQKYDEAQDLFKDFVLKCQRISPDELYLYEVGEYGTGMEVVGEFDLAARAYARGYRLDSSEPSFALNAGRNWRKVGAAYYDRAIELLYKVVEAENAETNIQAQAHTELGLIYMAQGLHTLSEKSFANALEEDPANVNAGIGSALIGIQQGKLVEGMSSLEKLSDLSPEQGAFINKGLATALSVLETNRVILANNAETHFAYAKLLLNTQRLTEAMFAVEHAVKLDDTDYAMHNMRGGLLMQQSLTDRAIGAYTRSLELNPNQPRTLEILKKLKDNG